MAAERAFVLRAAADWNRLRGRDTACYISILTWEEMVAPDLIGSVQDVVKSQIGHVYDVYLGIMWTRFGTPTDSAESGTEEEFNDALKIHKEGGKIRIATMFKVGAIDLANIDALQLHKVQEFKRRLSKEGAFYREFSDENSLSSALALLFEQVAKDAKTYSHSGQGHKVLRTNNEETALSGPITSSDDGLIEIGEEFETLSSRYVAHMTIAMEAEKSNTEVIASCTNVLSQITGLDSNDKAIIKENMRIVASSMETLSDKYVSIYKPLQQDSDRLSYLVDMDLRIRFETDDWHESGNANLVAASTFSGALEVAVSQLQSLSEITSSLPRLSGDVNRAKSRLTRERKRILEIFIGLKQSIDSSVEYFRRES